MRSQMIEQPGHPLAADLLVVAQREVDRRLEPALQEFRHERQRGRDEALHVRGAAAVAAARPGRCSGRGRSTSPGRRPARRRCDRTGPARAAPRVRSWPAGWPCRPRRRTPGPRRPPAGRGSRARTRSARGWNCGWWYRSRPAGPASRMGSRGSLGSQRMLEGDGRRAKYKPHVPSCHALRTGRAHPAGSWRPLVATAIDRILFIAAARANSIPRGRVPCSQNRSRSPVWPAA